MKPHTSGDDEKPSHSQGSAPLTATKRKGDFIKSQITFPSPVTVSNGLFRSIIDFISTMKHLFFCLGGNRVINFIGTFMFQEPTLFFWSCQLPCSITLFFLILSNNHNESVDEFTAALQKNP